MNLTKKQIDIIRSCTPKELRGKAVGSSSLSVILGYYHPSMANWSYVAGYIQHKGKLVLVVLQFGQVV